MFSDVEMISVFLYVLTLFVSTTLSTAKYDPFMDSVWFKMTWPGPKTETTQSSNLVENIVDDGLSVLMTSTNNEKYKCIIPDVKSKGDQDGLSYEGPDALSLLQPLFLQKSCSYRVETYWTYELCHGQFFRQYHEDKDLANKQTKIQEYYLGSYEKPELKEDSEENVETDKKEEKGKESKTAVPVRSLEGIQMPYFTVNMTNGTPCDLSKKKRRISLHYICQPQGKGEIYDFKETSTCEYEAIILTFLLCGHPDYQPKKKKVNEIQCHSLDGSPVQPQSLDALIKDSLDMQQQEKPITLDGQEVEDVSKRAPADRRQSTTISSKTDQELVRSFLSGEYCITGGVGWWKHELCYGKFVKQFHETETGERTDIILGTWNVEKHTKWLLQNPNKLSKPIEKRKHISQFYSSGDICDLTSNPREVEVKLTCKENAKQPHAISIYLLEPKDCEYVLVVESQLMCAVIEKGDDNNIIPLPPS